MDDFLEDQLEKIKECIRYTQILNTTRILICDSEYIELISLYMRIKILLLDIDIWNEDKQ
jgi:hypothetical protein